MNNQRGFSLVELMITMVIFVLVIVAASNIFLGVLTQFKQQSKIAETNIEGMIGLQMLKADIEQGGYGLPYDINGADYDEASGADVAVVGFDASAYNDAGVADAPPRGLVTGNNVTMTGQSDVLAVKATNVAINNAAQKFAYISNTGAANIVAAWTNSAGTQIAEETLANTDRVTVIRPQQGVAQKVLQVSGTFYTTFNNIAASAFAPATNSLETYLVYGISGADNPIMPFNRADYYVRTPATMPSQCALGTGVLYKGTINNTTVAASSGRHSELPLLDCVAAVKIALNLDMNEDGLAATVADADASTLSTTEGATTATVRATLADAALLRTRLKEIRVYILLHEGQRDTSYTSPAQMQIIDPTIGAGTPLLTYDVPNRNYRWKIYTMVISPYNLR